MTYGVAVVLGVCVDHLANLIPIPLASRYILRDSGIVSNLFAEIVHHRTQHHLPQWQVSFAREISLIALVIIAASLVLFLGR